MEQLFYLGGCAEKLTICAPDITKPVLVGKIRNISKTQMNITPKKEDKVFPINLSNGYSMAYIYFFVLHRIDVEPKDRVCKELLKILKEYDFESVNTIFLDKIDYEVFGAFYIIGVISQNNANLNFLLCRN